MGSQSVTGICFVLGAIAIHKRDDSNDSLANREHLFCMVNQECVAITPILY